MDSKKLNNKRTLSDLNSEDLALSMHFTDILDKNNVYFQHLQGDCICGKCICGQCKCQKQLLKVDFKKGMESLYQKEYVGHKRLEPLSIPNANTQDSYKSNHPMLLETTNRNELIKHNEYGLVKDYKPQEIIFQRAFNGASSYQNQYIDWGNSRSMVLKPPAHPTVIKDLPFMGSTYYRDNFKEHKLNQDKFIIYSKRSQFKNPLCPDLPFISDSTTNKTYKPFRTTSLNNLPKPKEFSSIPAFEGQFQSISQLDYNQKIQKKCPSKLVLSSIYNQKLKDALDQQ